MPNEPSFSPENAEPPPLLPSQLRLCCISASEPSWTVLALLLDKHGCHEPHFRWCETEAQALGVLREETFDCIVIFDTAPPGRGDSGLVSFLGAAAAGGSMEPTLVISTRDDDDRLLSLASFDCEVLPVAAGWQSRALPVWIARTVSRSLAARENLRLANADRRRTDRERDETDQLLEQQRRIVAERGREPTGAPEDECVTADLDAEIERLPAQVATYYQELLRTYVMMGSGNLSQEIRKLAQLLALAGLSPRAALRVHISRVEDLIRGLGSRSSRHVMARADMLAMELMIQLGECYREKSQRRGLGDYGIDLLHEQSMRQKS